jgi:DNA (cytosine-5)-methyltransferase 1
MKLRVLDLFSGIGGFSLGLERAGFETVAFCEIDKFCQRILKKNWSHIPILHNIQNVNYFDGVLSDSDGSFPIGGIDLICGGFPCQPFSVAGRKKGTEDDRDLWPEMFRIIKQVKPSWIIGENVANFTNMAFTRTKIDLESQGYIVQPFIIPACAIGAPHRRDRIWIVAYSESVRCVRGGENRNSKIYQGKICKDQQKNGDTIWCETSTSSELCGGVIANIDSKRCGAGGGDWEERSVLSHKKRNATQKKSKGNRWERGIGSFSNVIANNGSERIQGIGQGSICRESAFSWCKDIRRVEDYFSRSDIPKPLICRGDDGFSERVDRLKALGNSVVPQIPEIIGKFILDFESK